jgi:exopolyphosphatase/guanosine-5'-triphosphate,3'-diphosphate pyrophosphatase
MGVARSSIRGVATAACREAPNGAAFLSQIGEELHLPFDIIDGGREADLMALAQVHSFPDEAVLLAIDIGGGSTEVALRGGGADWSTSIPVGASKLGAELGRTPTLEATRRRVAQALESPWLGPIPENVCVIGVSGTVTTALQILDKADIWDPATLHGRTLKTEQIFDLARSVLTLSPEERLRLPGLHPGRADTIGPALVWLSALLERFGSSEIRVSDRGVRFGLLFESWHRAVVRP